MNEAKSNFKLKISSPRNFGIVFSIFFLLIGVYTLINNLFHFEFFFLISFFFIFFAFFFPKILIIPNRLWFKFRLLLGLLTTPIFMGLIFFLIIVPIGIIMKLFQKDLLNQKINKSLKTYWIPRSDQNSSMKDQF